MVEAAERLNYRPNYFARSLRQSRSMSVGVLAPDLSEGYFTRVMSGVVEELTAAHYFYFTACHDWKQGTDREVSAHAGGAGGGRISAAEYGGGATGGSGAGGGDLGACAAENVTNIVLDHHRAVQQALTHLYELGHRRIAIMRGPRAIPDSEFRWEAIQQVAREMDLKLDPASGDSHRHGGLVDEGRTASDGAGDRLQADAGAAGKNARFHGGVSASTILPRSARFAR